MRHPLTTPARLAALVALGLCSLAVPAGAATARPIQAATLDATDVARAIDQTGRFVDPSLPAADRGPDVEAAIDRANDAGIGVIIGAGDADVADLLTDVMNELDASNSSIASVLAFDDVALEADVDGASVAAIDRGFDGFDEGFASSGNAGAIDAFVAEITGAAIGATTTSLATDDTSTADTSNTDPAPAQTDSGGGFPWIPTFLLGIIAFFAGRFLLGRRKRRDAERAAVELDRTEISEQLRSNADRVIDLGDPVIASGDDEMIRLYEEASTTYQEVSLSLADATTATEIDALDDRIDQAEWQLAVIEARLAGRPEPRSPAEVVADAAPPPPSTGPALGADESVFDQRRGGGDGAFPAPPRRPDPAPRRSGGGLGGILIGILLGGASRPRTVSRRSQQRWNQPQERSGDRSSNDGFPGPSSGSSDGGGGSIWGGFGGGSSSSGGSRSGRSRSSSGGRSRSSGVRSSGGRSRSGRRR